MSLSVAHMGGAWKDDSKFSELAGLSVDLNRASVLLDNDIVAQRKPKASPLSGRLGSEEWIEHLLPHFGRNARAIVANSNFDAVPKISGCCSKARIMTVATIVCLTLPRRIKSVVDQV